MVTKNIQIYNIVGLVQKVKVLWWSNFSKDSFVIKILRNDAKDFLGFVMDDRVRGFLV